MKVRTRFSHLYALLALVCCALVIAAAIAPTATPAHARGNRLYFNGKNIYLNGENLAWMDFGNDFGGPHSANWEGRWANAFATLSANGVNATRIWVHVDGRSSPNFDGNGYVTGLSDQFYGDLQYVLDEAKKNNIGVELVLWAYDMDGRFNNNASHLDLLTDTSKTDSYINNAMLPMINYFDSHPALLAWDVMNEPEYLLAAEGASNNVITTYDLSRFIGKLAGAAHGASSKYITAAGASFKYLCDHSNAPDFYCTEGNIFSDSALQNASGDSRASLDYYQTHHYTDQQPGYFTPWAGRGPDYYLYDDKPVLIGEFRNNDAYGITNALNESYDLGYLGHMPFQYNSDPCCGSFNDSKYALKAFRDAHAGEVDLSISGQPWP